MNRRFWIWMVAGVLVAQLAAADVWQDLAAYHYGDERVVPDEVDKLVTETPADKMAAVEAGLIGVVSSDQASDEAKAFSCRMLQRVGSAKAIPALSGLLGHATLSHYARLALERISDPLAGQALRDALATAPDALKVGILGSLAERDDVEAAPAAAQLAAGGNADVARAAIQALGKISGNDAATALQQLSVPGELVDVRHAALVACAQGLTAAGEQGVASKLLQAVLTDTKSSQVRKAAALHGLHDADGGAAAPAFEALLKGPDGYARNAALTCVGECPGATLSGVAASTLASFPAPRQAELLALLSRRGDPSVLTAVVAVLNSTKDSSVRETAAATVSQLGGPEQVDMLLSLASDGMQAAVPALAAMQAPGVEERLMAALRNDELVLSALAVFQTRESSTAAQEMVQLVQSKEAAVRKQAWACLRRSAGDEQLPALMKVYAAIKDDAERREAEAALKAAFGRCADRDLPMKIATPYYESGSDAVKTFVLDVAAISGSPSALELVRGALSSTQKAVHDKALRALATWPNPAAAPALLKLVKEGGSEVDRILSLRGYIQVAAREGNQGKRLQMYRTASPLCTRPDEKRLVISGIAQVRHADALGQLAGYLDQEDVKAEAERALADLCWDLRRHAAKAVAPVAKRLMEQSDNKQIVDRAKRAYNETKDK